MKSIGQVDTVTIGDMTAQSQVPWRFADTHWGFVDQDVMLCGTTVMQPLRATGFCLEATCVLPPRLNVTVSCVIGQARRSTETPNSLAAFSAPTRTASQKGELPFVMIT